MNKFTPEQITKRIVAVRELNLTKNDIINVKEEPGGLVNYVFRIETRKGLFFLKQFLEELKADVFKNLEIGPKDRLRLSYKVEKKFEEILNQQNHIVPHIYLYNEAEGYLIVEGFENVVSLLEKIKNGIFPKQPLLNLAKAIAKIHQQTFSEPNNSLDLYNSEWLGLKLKYQYYEMIKFLNEKNGKKLKDFTDNYKNQRFVLTHGDLCSINIFLHDKEESAVHLIDFEDAHIGSPAFDLGYLLSEYFIASKNFPEKKEEINENIKEFLAAYFSIFNKQSRNLIETEVTMHTASMMLYRTFGLSKDTFTKYLKDDIVRNSIKSWVAEMIENSNKPISYFVS